jgi:hypothetical protein
MSARSGVWPRRVVTWIALVGLVACGGERFEAQPDGPVGLSLLDSAPLATTPALEGMTPAAQRGSTRVSAERASDFVTVQRGASAPDSLQLPQLRRWCHHQYEIAQSHQDELRTWELSCEALRQPRVDATLVSSLGGGDWCTAGIPSCCYSTCWIRGSESGPLPRN